MLLKKMLLKKMLLKKMLLKKEDLKKKTNDFHNLFFFVVFFITFFFFKPFFLLNLSWIFLKEKIQRRIFSIFSFKIDFFCFSLRMFWNCLVPNFCLKQKDRVERFKQSFYSRILLSTLVLKEMQQFFSCQKTNSFFSVPS